MDVEQTAGPGNGNGGGSGAAGPFDYYADQLDNIVTADVEAVAALAPAEQDSTYAGVTVRAHDDGIEQGVLLPLRIPSSGFSQLSIEVWSKCAQLTTGAPDLVNVGRNFYERGVIGNSTAFTAFSGAVALDNIVFPVGASATEFLVHEQTKTLASLGLVAGQAHQIVLSRNPGVANDVVGDWRAWLYRLTFIV